MAKGVRKGGTRNPYAAGLRAFKCTKTKHPSVVRGLSAAKRHRQEMRGYE